MTRSHTFRLLPLLALLCLGACILDAKRPPPGSNPGSTWAMGVSLDPSAGTLKLATGANYRKHYEQRFSTLISETLNRGWRAEVDIVPDARHLPPDTDGPDDDGWFWNFAAVTVALVGDGSAPRPTVDDEADPATIRRMLTRFVTDVMRDKMDRRAPLSVEVVSRLELEPPDSNAPPTAVRPVAGFEPGAELREGNKVEKVMIGPIPRDQLPDVSGTMYDYTVQEGDSLATISIVFYKSPDYWRHILAANPDLDPSSLEAGMKIKVPAEPKDTDGAGDP